MERRAPDGARVTVRRALVIGVLGCWALVSIARLSRLVEPPPVPPGQELAPTFELFRDRIPSDAGYLFVLPGEFGQDTGDGPRLRYALYPRRYDDVRASEDVPSVRALMQREDLRFIVVPDARQYAPGSWLRQPQDWLRRIDLGPEQYLLELSPGG
jgi:hypothetical protein